MLIKVSHPQKFYGSRGSDRMKREDESRYYLRGGMARLALQTKVSGKKEVDCVGRPLKYSNEMSERHNAGTLEQWAKGRSTKMIGVDSFCSIRPHGAKRTPWPWEKKG